MPAFPIKVMKTPIPKTCRTCAHRDGRGEFARCMLRGYYTTVERKNPSGGCANFAGWVPRESVLQRIKNWLI